MDKESLPIFVGSRFSLRSRAEAVLVDHLKRGLAIEVDLGKKHDGQPTDDPSHRSLMLSYFRDLPDIPVGATADDFAPADEVPDWAQH